MRKVVITRMVRGSIPATWERAVFLSSGHILIDEMVPVRQAFRRSGVGLRALITLRECRLYRIFLVIVISPGRIH